MRNLERFSSGVEGAVLTARSPGFEDAARVFNAGAQHVPAVIVQVANDADVQAALRFARDEGLPLSVRGGGHSVAGHGVAPGAVVIDLRRLNRTSVDLSGRTITVGGGCLWSDVLDALESEHGVPGAFDPRVGVAGLTLGGGYGMLSRLHGLAADNLQSADVILADGTKVTASARDEPELFWALRGAGANFGVVTSMRFSIHPLQPLWTLKISSPLSRLRELLFVYGLLVSRLPDEATVYLGIGERLELQGFFFGHPTAGEDLLADLAGDDAVLGELAPREYAMAHVANTDTFPANHHHRWRSHFLPTLEVPVIELIRAYATGNHGWLMLEHLGGAIGRIASDATAFPRRAAKIGLVTALKWPAHAPRPTSALRAQQRLHEALKPFSFGSYVNYLDQPEELAAYGTNLPRLREAKKQFDPKNVFRSNINLTPGSR